MALGTCSIIRSNSFSCAIQVNAVFAADAMARLTGTVGTVAVTAGPGLTNTITAIKNAQMAESPILLLGILKEILSLPS